METEDGKRHYRVESIEQAQMAAAPADSAREPATV